MKDCIAWLRFLIVRGLERCLPVPLLRAALMPVACVRSIFQRPSPPAHRPACLGEELLCPTRESPNAFLNRTLEFFPDRLRSVRWAGRCRIIGLEHWHEARRGGRPVILAFAHFGPIRLLRAWLRAAGVPVAALIAADAQTRPKLKRLQDRVHPFPETPTYFCLNQLRDATGFIAAGNTIMVALDHPVGKRVAIPLDAEWSFEMSAGALRLAAHHGAEVIPCCIVDEGGWRFQIQLGRPVPEEFLGTEPDLVRAGRHLLAELLPLFRRHPDQCEGKLLERFQRTNAAAPAETVLQIPADATSSAHAPEGSAR